MNSKNKENLVTKKYENQKEFWERAGEIGYGEAIFANREVEKHIMSKQWATVMAMADFLGLDGNSKVLELGCGEGLFARHFLAPRFKHVDAFEISSAAVERARSEYAAENVTFEVRDVVKVEYGPEDYWDGVFLVGFVHHVKNFTPEIIARLARVTSNVIVLEPNGDNLIRKMLELSPSYRAAGEDSFNLNRLVDIFQSNGFSLMHKKSINFVPQFCPLWLLPVLRKMEKIIEPSKSLNALCSTHVLGFQKN